jgi:hypothetical protein
MFGLLSEPKTKISSNTQLYCFDFNELLYKLRLLLTKLVCLSSRVYEAGEGLTDANTFHGLKSWQECRDKVIKLGCDLSPDEKLA